MQASFGAGRIIGVRQDVNPAIATPVHLGIMQDVQIEVDGDLKPLYGSQQFPVELARGKGKITGKAKFARISGAVWNELYFGQTIAAGQTLIAFGEAASVPATSTYTITAANSTTFTQDLGVIYALTGMPLTKVASGPTIGQYSQTAGVYTFAAADASAAVLLNYQYTATGGYTISLTNQDMGALPIWKGVFTNTFRGKRITMTLNALGSSKLTFPTKQDDWVISELDFQAKADDAGNIGTLSLAE